MKKYSVIFNFGKTGNPIIFYSKNILGIIEQLKETSYDLNDVTSINDITDKGEK